MIKSWLFFIESAKWGLIVYLLLPLHKAMSEPVNFTRILFGILLFIVFSGKLFYDVILQKKRDRAERSAAADLLSTIGMAVAIALVVGLVVISVGMAVLSLLQQAGEQE
jgi:hypothetical protein